VSRDIVPGAILRHRYRILELVGQGGAGAVYRAADLRLAGRETAIKIVHPDRHASPDAHAEAQAQFQREASILAQLDHPVLPKVSDYFVEGGIDCLVMDFVAGPDLRQVVDEARANGDFLDEARVLAWAAQLLDALEYLHCQDPPVIHRDIKPSNIKLITGERVKLVDFGLVKHLDPTDPRTLTTSRGIGSLPYTPLEQYAGDTGHTDVRSDLYALGATLYHLLTGRPPATAHERFLMPNALVPPGRINPHLSPLIESVILTAMALHPERRPVDAAAFRDVLTGATPLAADPDLGTSSAAWRAGLWDNAGLIALVGLLLLLAVLATWQAERGSSPATQPAISGTTSPAITATPMVLPSRP
jgi:eukaryotic-like serine/threonine-protein kinase